MNTCIDWNEIWKERMRKCVSSGRGLECAQTWDDEREAREYFEAQRHNPAARERLEDLMSLAPLHGRVLDIGAGPGTISVPLARKTAHVTAVEPAAGMALLLQEQIAAARLTNLTLVRKKWDDVDPGPDLNAPYDLTFASFSLGMADLRAAFEKMTAVTAGHIVVYWHAGLQAWDRDALVLWPLLHGREFSPIPKSDVVFNVLYSMDIYPEVRLLRLNNELVYDTFEAALTVFARRYEAQTGKQKELLSAYLDDRLECRDGRYILPRSQAAMRFSWNTKDG